MSAFQPQEFENVPLCSPPRGFRVGVSQGQQFLTLWMEDKVTKQQWSLEIPDINSFGPDGIAMPPAVVLNMMKKALELSSSGTVSDSKAEEPSIEAEESSQGMLLKLKYSFAGMWSPEYRFPLLQKEVDAVTRLESQLRDCRADINAVVAENQKLKEGYEARFQREVDAMKRECRAEIQRLKDENAALRQQRQPYFSLTVTNGTNFGSGQVITWNGAQRQLSDLVTVSANNATVTIVRTGLYQIYVRCIHNCSGNFDKNGLSLRLNGSEISICPDNNGHGYHQHSDVVELLPLRANDRLEVYYSGNANCYGNESTTRFWGLYLSE